MTESWTIRKYDSDIDIDGILYLYLKSFAHSSYGRSRGAHVDGSDAERKYWAEHREVVLKLLANSDTVIICDPESPTVIWAFACVRGDVLHYIVVKRKFREFAQEMFAALLGDRLDRAIMYTHCLQGTGLTPPKGWTLNPYAVLGEVAS